MTPERGTSCSFEAIVRRSSAIDDLGIFGSRYAGTDRSAAIRSREASTLM